MRLHKESPALVCDRAPRNALLGGVEHLENSRADAREQACDLARHYERTSQGHAAEGRGTSGVASFQRRALAHHYARLARLHMEGAR